MKNDFSLVRQNVSCERSTYIASFLTLMFPFGRDAAFSVTDTVSNPVQLASINIKIKGESTLLTVVITYCFAQNFKVTKR